MRTINLMLTGTLVGILVGLWMGINIGRERPLFTSPFKEQSMQEQLNKTGKLLKEKSDQLIEKSGEKIRQTKEALNKKLNQDGGD